MKTGIGIDTGGTYTDAVVYDFETHRVLASAKALTTRENLTIGIGNALDGLPGPLLRSADMVSLSTTLATNACVENKGGRARLLFMGVEKKTVDWVGADYGLKDNGDLYFCEKKGSFDGTVVNEPDWEALLADTEPWLMDAEGLAVVDMYAVNNGAVRERKAKELYSRRYGMPIICGHELFADLNSIRRGASALLNARLVPIIEEFLRSVKAALDERGIAAPVVIVRSDGTLMSESFSRLRPVETVLCGPAASVLGGFRLTGERDCIIVDMGGTTTDVSLVKAGAPVRVSGGVRVGPWKTCVKGIFIDTFGLGGDSAIRVKNDDFYLDVRRVMPLSMAASRWPSILADLRALAASGRTHSLPLHEFFYRVRDISGSAGYTPGERAFVKALGSRPMGLAEAARAAGTDLYGLDTRRLEDEGVVMRCGLTATDIMHILGDFDRFDREAAELAARFVAGSLPGYGGGEGLTRFCEDVYDRIRKTLYVNIVRILLQDQNTRLLKDGPDRQLDGLIARSWEAVKSGRESYFEFGFSTKAVLVGIGAPTHLFLPKVARVLGTRCVIPDNAGVANAIGAVVGNVAVTSRVEIVPNYTVSGISDYTVFGKTRTVVTEGLEEAIEIATGEAERDARDEAVRRGVTGEISVDTRVVSQDASARDNQAIQLGTTVVATAIGAVAL